MEHGEGEAQDAGTDEVPPGVTAAWLVPTPLSRWGSPSLLLRKHLNSSLYVLACLGNILIQAENLGQLFVRAAFAGWS